MLCKVNLNIESNSQYCALPCGRIYRMDIPIVSIVSIVLCESRKQINTAHAQ